MKNLLRTLFGGTPAQPSFKRSDTPSTLQTDSANVRSELQGRELTNLPVPVGRNYQNMLVTIPGFSPPSNGHSVQRGLLRAQSVAPKSICAWL